MKLWIGRDNPIISEDMENYIERHPEDKIQYTKLHVFYDKPIWKDGEIMLFPSKTNRNWETFPKPFVDGDIVTCKCGAAKQIFIFKEYAANGTAVCYCFLDVNDRLSTDSNIYYVTQHATQQEKERFFIALNKHGYRWNPDTKTLSKLPKFKKGDKVRVKNGVGFRTINDVCDTFYTLIPTGKIVFTDQNNWELVSDKFDISTLIPFESKVLVRSSKGECWTPAFFGRKCKDNGYITTFGWCQYCIPYKGNEILFKTNNDCDDFYKTWENNN